MRSAPLVFLAAATWLPLGTMLSYLGRRWRMPLLGLLLLLAIPFSWLNENHPVRAEKRPFRDMRTVEQDLVRWRDFISRKEVAPRHPLVIVAAEGAGRSRATGRLRCWRGSRTRRGTSPGRSTSRITSSP